MEKVRYGGDSGPGVYHIFVPGRVCLLGEHTDWASQYYHGGEGNRIKTGGIVPEEEDRREEKVEGTVMSGESSSQGVPWQGRPRSMYHSPYGHCLVYGTGDLGIHAHVSFCDSHDSSDEVRSGRSSSSSQSSTKNVMVQYLLVRTVSSEGAVEEGRFLWDIPALTEVAKSGGHFSYVCGVVAHMMAHPIYGAVCSARAINIRNDKTTLPQGKGLSSSAAVCVLVVKAFNLLCNLHMSVDEVMSAAYEGEVLTPSKCGRMDQCVAFGSCCVSMDFDHGVLSCTKVHTKKKNVGGNYSNTIAAPTTTEALPLQLYLVVADLHRGKDTVQILTDLQRAFQAPSPCTDGDQAAQAVADQRAIAREFLGKTSLVFSKQAQDAVAEQDGATLGRLMSEAQSAFRRALQPLCPTQLTSTRLYAVLEHPAVQPLVFGGKGVGSQGDGTVQFVAKSREAQCKLIELLQSVELGCSAYPMTL